VVGLDGRQCSEADLEGVVRMLVPLGRDGSGGWAGTAGRSGVAVAATLRHSTPEDAADCQPAESRGGSLVLVGDLRLDNRDELAGVLDLSDHTSVPDSAFVLAGYERWGEAVLDRMVGEFALAIVDRRRGGVLVARDHVGTRPLVIHERPGVVAFASTALALTGFDGVGHALDVRRAMEVLAGVFDTGRTFVEGVRWLPPASALWIEASGVRRWTWWKADPHDIRDLGSPAAHERELREAFDRAERSGPRRAAASTRPQRPPRRRDCSPLIDCARTPPRRRRDGAQPNALTGTQTSLRSCGSSRRCTRTSSRALCTWNQG